MGIAERIPINLREGVTGSARLEISGNRVWLKTIINGEYYIMGLGNTGVLVRASSCVGSGLVIDPRSNKSYVAIVKQNENIWDIDYGEVTGVLSTKLEFILERPGKTLPCKVWLAEHFSEKFGGIYWVMIRSPKDTIAGLKVFGLWGNGVLIRAAGVISPHDYENFIQYATAYPKKYVPKLVTL